MKGWVKMYRKLLDWEWYSDSKMVHLFIHMMLKANHKPGKWKGHLIESGQFISGRKMLSAETGISERSVRTCLDRLKESDVVTIKTTSKFSLFEINNWDMYQNEEQSDLQNDQLPTRKRPATDQETTTNKNDNNEKNKKNKKELPPVFFEVAEHLKRRVLQIRQQKITDATLFDWANCVRLMCDRDKRTIQDINQLIDECHDMEPRGNNGFTWRNNILSMSKLRLRWNEGKIFLGMNKTGAEPDAEYLAAEERLRQYKNGHNPYSVEQNGAQG